MKRTERITTLLMAAALLLTGPRLATALPIDFETLADLEVVTNQFAAQGIIFSNTIALQSGAVGGTLNDIDFPPASGVTVVNDDGAPIMLVLTTPFSFISGLFTYNTQVTLQAFSDAAGVNLIGSVTSAFTVNTGTGGDPGSSPNELLQLSGLGPIGSVKIIGDPGGSSFSLDNLDGAPVIPEPGTLLLLGSGLGSLWWHRRRQAH